MKLIEQVTERWKGKKLTGAPKKKAEAETTEVLVALAETLLEERAVGNELGRWLMSRLSR
jgi:hypothetical protein